MEHLPPVVQPYGEDPPLHIELYNPYTGIRRRIPVARFLPAEPFSAEEVLACLRSSFTGNRIQAITTWLADYCAGIDSFFLDVDAIVDQFPPAIEPEGGAKGWQASMLGEEFYNWLRVCQPQVMVDFALLWTGTPTERKMTGLELGVIQDQLHGMVSGVSRVFAVLCRSSDLQFDPRMAKPPGAPEIEEALHHMIDELQPGSSFASNESYLFQVGYELQQDDTFKGILRFQVDAQKVLRIPA